MRWLDRWVRYKRRGIPGRRVNTKPDTARGRGGNPGGRIGRDGSAAPKHQSLTPREE